MWLGLGVWSLGVNTSLVRGVDKVNAALIIYGQFNLTNLSSVTAVLSEGELGSRGRNQFAYLMSIWQVVLICMTINKCVCILYTRPDSQLAV